MKMASTGLVILGLALLVTSVFWGKVAAPAPEPISEEKQEEYDKAIVDAHANRANRESVNAETKAVLEEVSRQTAEFEATRGRGSMLLQVSGILATLVGVGLYFWKGRLE